MRSKKGVFQSVRQDWKTPKDFYKKLNKEFHFDFDPCPSKNYTNGGKVNGLECEWGKVNYCNPPYTSKGKAQDKWIKKGFEEWKKGKTVVFLIPARTDTIRFHEYLLPYCKPEDIRFIKGRLKFEGAKHRAPFPSMICVLRGKNAK